MLGNELMIRLRLVFKLFTITLTLVFSFISVFLSSFFVFMVNEFTCFLARCIAVSK